MWAGEPVLAPEGVTADEPLTDLEPSVGRRVCSGTLEGMTAEEAHEFPRFLLHRHAFPSQIKFLNFRA